MFKLIFQKSRPDKKRFVQFRRKITAYADMVMMYINSPVHSHIQKFANETIFRNCNSALIPRWLVIKIVE